MIPHEIAKLVPIAQLGVQVLVLVVLYHTFRVYERQLAAMVTQLQASRDAASAQHILYERQLDAMVAQLQASRDAASAQHILDVMNLLEAPDVRDAREIVRRILASKSFGSWTEDERSRASRVCSTYDHAALVIRMDLVPQKPFVENWGASIRQCFEVTKPLIEERRKPQNSGPSYWQNFEWLYEQVMQRTRGGSSCQTAVADDGSPEAGMPREQLG